jgi:hypothetical protein
MLGKGWFPSELGGLERYYRELLEQLPEARGIVVGPAEDASASVTTVSEHSAPLPNRRCASNSGNLETTTSAENGRLRGGLATLRLTCRGALKLQSMNQRLDSRDKCCSAIQNSRNATR